MEDEILIKYLRKNDRKAYSILFDKYFERLFTFAVRVVFREDVANDIVQEIFIILENFRLCLIQRTLEELPDFEVMTWQLCRMLRSALNCFQVTRFCVQK